MVFLSNTSPFFIAFIGCEGADVIVANLQSLLGDEAAVQVVAGIQNQFVTAWFQLNIDGSYTNSDGQTGRGPQSKTTATLSH